MFKVALTLNYASCDIFVMVKWLVDLSVGRLTESSESYQYKTKEKNQFNMRVERKKTYITLNYININDKKENRFVYWIEWLQHLVSPRCYKQ